MRHDVALRWAEALESGRYVQGREALRTYDHRGNVAYCCLGVLCDISGLGTWDHKNDYLGVGAYLPEPVVRWANLGSSTGYGEPTLTDVPGLRRRVGLATLNDDRWWDFPRIAELIRERWADL